MKKPRNLKQPANVPHRRQGQPKPGIRPPVGKSISRPVYNFFGRVVGAIDGETLKKHASGSKHMLRKPLGWAWDTAILEEASRANVRMVEIIDLEAGLIYRSELVDFVKKGISFDHGYGPQICLPLGYWEISGWKPSTLVSSREKPRHWSLSTSSNRRSGVSAGRKR